MEWACPECDRRYHDPPEECVCGGQLVPAGTPESSDGLSRLAENVHRVLFDPESADRSLLDGGTTVQTAFRLLVAFATLLLLLLVAGIVANAVL